MAHGPAGPPPGFIVLWRHSCTHSHIYCLWQLAYYNGAVEWLQQLPQLLVKLWPNAPQPRSPNHRGCTAGRSQVLGQMWSACRTWLCSCAGSVGPTPLSLPLPPLLMGKAPTSAQCKGHYVGAAALSHDLAS